MFAALAAALMCSCGPGGLPGAGSRIDPFLEQAGFSAPVSVQINTDRYQIFGYGNSVEAIQNSDNVHAISFLVANGVISVAPMPEGPPYWKLQTADGGAIAGRQSFAFGTRRITGRSEARSWKEESIDYFAETLTYMVDVSPQLGNVQPRELGPFTARVMIADDPRVGDWALRSIDFSTANARQADLFTAQQIVSAQGSAARQQFLQAVVNARGVSFQAIADQLATNGVIAGDPRHDNVRISTANNLALAFLAPVQRSSIRELVERCQSLSLEGYSNWRVAGYGDLARFMRNNFLIDAPDGRYWSRYRNNTIIDPFVTGASSGTGGHFTALAGRVYSPNIAYYRFNDNGSVSRQTFGTSYGPHRYFTGAELYTAQTDFNGKLLTCATTVN